ncbi:MAG: sortase [Vicinamibacterales bacterium]
MTTDAIRRTAGWLLVAAHRDMDFRPLRKIRVGDVVRFLSADAMIEYVVRETLVVEPTDLGVLHATERPTLTLITCHPFTYIGPAPQRFVVRAERITDAVLNPVPAG